MFRFQAFQCEMDFIVFVIMRMDGSGYLELNKTSHLFRIHIIFDVNKLHLSVINNLSNSNNNLIIALGLIVLYF